LSMLTQLMLRSLTGLTQQLLVLRAQTVPSSQGASGIIIRDVTTGLISCFLFFLLPSGWLLSYVESYKTWE
ncbi:COX8A oxidase, partial [Crocuta crocuta]